jgi:hypothetical protein
MHRLLLFKPFITMKEITIAASSTLSPGLLNPLPGSVAVESALTPTSHLMS